MMHYTAAAFTRRGPARRLSQRREIGHGRLGALMALPWTGGFAYSLRVA
jgi:hypothetical protein